MEIDLYTLLCIERFDLSAISSLIANLNQLKQFIDDCKSNPSILSDLSLSFFRDYLERREPFLSRSWKKTVMLRRRLRCRETGGSNRAAHTGYFAQSNLNNYVFRFSYRNGFGRSLLRRMLSRTR
ncbi:unnamed protein product [Camellia sinensis]